MKQRINIDQGIDLIFLSRIFMEKFWLILVVTIGFMLAGVFYAKVSPKVYVSSAKIMLRETPALEAAEQCYQDYLKNLQVRYFGNVKGFKSLMYSRPVLEKVSNRLIKSRTERGWTLVTPAQYKLKEMAGWPKYTLDIKQNELISMITRSIVFKSGVDQSSVFSLICTWPVKSENLLILSLLMEEVLMKKKELREQLLEETLEDLKYKQKTELSRLAEIKTVLEKNKVNGAGLEPVQELKLLNSKDTVQRTIAHISGLMELMNMDLKHGMRKELLLEKPRLNPEPVKPNMKIIVILFTAAGLLASFLLVFLLYFMNDRLSVYSIMNLFTNTVLVNKGDLKVFISDYVTANGDSGPFLALVSRKEFDADEIAPEKENGNFAVVTDACSGKEWMKTVTGTGSIFVIFSEKQSKYKQAAWISDLIGQKQGVIAVVVR